MGALKLPIQKGRKPRQLDWFRSSDLPKNQVFDGTVTALHFREGFGLHTLNAHAVQAFEIETVRKPGAVLHCFLEGDTEASLDGRPMDLGRKPGRPVRMVLTSLQEAETFWRRSLPGEYVRKVNILMSHDWLDDNGLGVLKSATDEWAKARYEWSASAEDIAAMEALAAKHSFEDPVERMQAEAIALNLVAGTFSKLSHQTEAQVLSPQEQIQLARMEELARGEGKMPSLGDLAEAGNASTSKVSRLFRTAHGCSALHFVRGVRLDQAFETLVNNRSSVAQAAYDAGYSSPENFSTAFKRHHGVSPSELRRGTKR
ncbi:AraC family transcriptional regulator [Shimia sp. CNT1-13L.2]|uniref:helix-turn-helix domain-containing protein n=1 Tax=Shimia sp. CNT1-13L.2 TaxID=2959663 RepID=UPI0020CEE123|nr:AraC family transcriptional regulator [Shimia sp. CNT1-13L.2]MCP9484093.1 AraC family transcriptional regulator [Shimia sp. CNT1-13L.2]